MPIKYAEMTIVRNLEKESWLTYFKNLLGEEIITNNDTIIILFDDGTMMDIVEYKDTNEQFKMGPKSYRHNYPIYFTINNLLALFKEPTQMVGYGPNLFSYIEWKLDSKPIFKDYPNYNTLKKEPSIYNMIYENSTKTEDVFAIVKRKSNLYLLAYDDSYFEKSDVVNLLHNLFIGL
jgi:hypothetical protein